MQSGPIVEIEVNAETYASTKGYRMVVNQEEEHGQAEIHSEEDIKKWVEATFGKLFRADKITADLNELAIDWDNAEHTEKREIIRRMSILYGDLCVAAQFVLAFISLHCMERSVLADFSEQLRAAHEIIDVKAEFLEIPVLKLQFKIFFNYASESFYQELMIRRYVDLTNLGRAIDKGFQGGEAIAYITFKNIASNMVQLLQKLDEAEDYYDFILASTSTPEEYEELLAINLNREIYIDKLPFLLGFLTEEELVDYAFLKIPAITAQAAEIVKMADGAVIAAEPENAEADITSALEASAKGIKDARVAQETVIKKLEQALLLATGIITKAYTADYEIDDSTESLAALAEMKISLVDNQYVMESTGFSYLDAEKLLEKLNVIRNIKEDGMRKVNIYNLRYKFKQVANCVDWLSNLATVEHEVELITSPEASPLNQPGDTPRKNVYRKHKKKKPKKSREKTHKLTTMSSAVLTEFSVKDILEEEKNNRLRQIDLLNEEFSRLEKAIHTIFTPEYLTTGERASNALLVCQQNMDLVRQKALNLKAQLTAVETKEEKSLPVQLTHVQQLELAIADVDIELSKQREFAIKAVLKKERMDSLIKFPRRNSDNLNEKDQKTLATASKYLLYLNKLLALEDIDPDIKLFGLLYNIFCCFEALQRFKRNEDKEESSSHAIAVLAKKYSANMLTLEIITELVHNLQKVTTHNKPSEEVWRKELNHRARDVFFPEFKDDDSADITKTKLYIILATFDKTKVEEGTVNQELLLTFIDLIRSILARFTSSETIKDPEQFTDRDLFELQALRMLGILANEYWGKKGNSFLQFCGEEGRKGVSYESRGANLHVAVIWFARQLAEKLPELKKLVVRETAGTPKFPASSPRQTVATAPATPRQSVPYAPGSPSLFALPGPQLGRDSQVTLVRRDSFKKTT